MNKIMKSYLKTFFKNWLSTLFMIIFIVTLAASVIGMLATPLQIYSKMQSAQKQNIAYNTNYSSRKNEISYSEDFVVNYSKKYLDENFISLLDEKIKQELGVSSTSSADEKNELLTLLVNNALKNYRSGANLSAIELDVKDSNINPKQILNLHIQKSLKEAYYELNNFLQDDDKTKLIPELSSILFSAFYRVYSFASMNGISIELNLLPINEIKTIEDLKKMITALMENIEKSFEAWKPQTIKISAYTIFDDKYSEILASSKYQHDDRIFLFDQILNSNSNKELYKLNINKNFAFSNSNSLPTESKKTFEIKNDSGEEFNNIIFDKKAKNSKRADKWRLGQMPEVVISSAYATKNKINVGDEIEIPSQQISNTAFSKILDSFNFAPKEGFFNSENLKVKVVGIGQTFDDFVPGPNYSSFSQTMENYGFLYFNQSFINEFRNYSWNFLTSSSNYGLEVKIKNAASAPETPYNLFTLNKDGEEIKILSNLETSLIPWKETSLATSLDNLKIRIIINLVLGIIILVLSFVFINFQLKKEMNETRKQLGIFKSFGYKTSELSWIFSIKTGLIFLISLIIGFFISIPIQLFAAQAFDNTITISFSRIYTSPMFLFSLFIIIPGLFLLISYITTIFYIKEPVLSLMSNGKKVKTNIKQPFIFRKIFTGQATFNWRLRRAFVKTSKGKFYTVQILFAAASFTYILLFGAQTLMTKMLNQTFAVYNEKIDHMFQWGNSNPQVDIKDANGKYVYKKTSKENVNYKYSDYSAFDNTNDYLKSIEAENDIRFKVDAVIQMTNNYFMSLKTISEKVEFMLPKDEMLYILETSKIKTEPINVNEEGKKLNFISTILNYDLNSQDANYIKAVEEVKQTGETKEKININSNLKNENSLTIGNMNSEQAKNIFSKDLAYIYSLKTAQIDLTYSVLPELMGKTNGEKIGIKDFATKVTSENFNKAYKKLQESNLVNKVNILSDQQIKVSENWLLTQFIDIFDDEFKGLVNILVQSNFANMSTTSSNVFKTVQLTDYANYDNYDYMMNINEIMFDKENEVLFNTVMLSQEGTYDDLDVSARLVNTQSNDYGNFEQAFNFADISAEQMNRFKNSEKENAGTDIINGIIPYSMAKTYNYKVNDIIELETKTTVKQKVRIRIVGINKNESIKMLVNTIWLSNEHFKNMYYSENLKQIPMYSNLYSKNKMLDIDLKNKDMTKMLMSLKVIEQNFTIQVKANKAIMADILKPIFKTTQTMYQNEKPDSKSIINPYILGISKMSVTSSFVINTLVINKATEIVNQIMLVFVLLTTILLAIILVVIIGIIVEEAKIIILTLQALGYKDKEINWVVMGSYAIGALVSFIIAYVGSVIFWKILLNWIAGKFSVYIFMSVDLRTILITLGVISVVLLFGWYASNKQVKRNPLTQITSLA
ncbi:ABC transporter permease [Mesoplasma entomophilum]|uniref:ABC3 transporter permease C-terminal domain-containing protein n=1 Tax=Mesoplasma entomophilum TaxID=2149 RepID=A0A3S5Y061_9MOLU|nr:FtsX-like permease family protein [Mesoplasma entomophilum]ATQ35559.1 hypothetical protein CS528_02165 [Mesoplasma entomophilum]ATZ19523.1 ABC transporter permease [Mesoplasma entomophilum]